MKIHEKMNSNRHVGREKETWRVQRHERRGDLERLVHGHGERDQCLDPWQSSE